MSFAALDASVQGWIANVRYADTWGLRAHLFGAPELPLRTFCTVRREWSSRRQLADGRRILLEELSGLSEPPMIIRMTASGPPQRYDHRLRDLVQRTGDLTIATDLGVPRSTARGWLRATPTIVVTLELADLTEQELRQELRELRRRVEKLAALHRLALALLHTSGFTLRVSVSRTDTPSCESCASVCAR